MRWAHKRAISYYYYCPMRKFPQSLSRPYRLAGKRRSREIGQNLYWPAIFNNLFLTQKLIDSINHQYPKNYNLILNPISG